MRGRWWFAVALAAAGLAAILGAQRSSYEGFEERPLKALGAEEIADYHEGRGMGLALAAELNGYPGPKHVLELASELELTPAQRHAVEEIERRMHEAAVALGEEIVAQEASLDLAFADGAIDAASLERRIAEIAGLQGRLRAVHLAAHLETREVLGPGQRRAYERLRGYGGGRPSEHSGHH